MCAPGKPCPAPLDFDEQRRRAKDGMRAYWLERIAASIEKKFDIQSERPSTVESDSTSAPVNLVKLAG